MLEVLFVLLCYKDIVIVFFDVVMEEDDLGFRFVNIICYVLGNNDICIVLLIG